MCKYYRHENFGNGNINLINKYFYFILDTRT